jgi:hypothetical protein
MRKTKKVKHTNKKDTNKKGGKNKKCKTKCQKKFLNEIKKDKRYKIIQNLASFFKKKNIVENQANLVLNSKDIQNDEVFKDCVKKCEKN